VGFVGPGLNLKLSDSGELVLEAGSAALVSGRTAESAREAIAQAARCRLRTFLGEWFLDSSIGVPWFEQVLGVKPRGVNAARVLLRDELLKVPGVTAVLEVVLAFDGSTRTLSGTFRAATELGELEGSF
jgi:hypothetical protein